MAAPKTKIEFLPREEWERRPIGRFLKWALTVGRHIVIFTELVVILAFVSRFKLDRDLSNLNEKIEQQQAIILSSAQFEKDFRFLQKRLSKIEKLRKDQLEADRLMSELAGLIPVDVFLSHLNISQNEVSFTATTFSEAGLATLLNNLSESPRFINLSISRLVASEAQGVGIKFDLRTEIKSSSSVREESTEE